MKDKWFLALFYSMIMFCLSILFVVYNHKKAITEIRDTVRQVHQYAQRTERRLHNAEVILSAGLPHKDFQYTSSSSTYWLDDVVFVGPPEEEE